MRILILAALLFAVPASAAPALRPERVILHTDAGDLVVALYAGAPRHAAKLLALFRDGAYDGAPISKVDSTRFAAIASLPGTKASRLPVESGGPHVPGVVSMAHQPGDADAGETAFVILFAAIPSMDGRFSAVGEVVGGRDVLEALKSAPVDGESRPVRPLAVRTSAVLSSEAALAKAILRGPDYAALGRDEGASRRRVLLGLAVLGLVLGAGLLPLRGRLGPAAPSVGLLSILAGYFAAFAALTDLSASSAWLSVPLFAATVGVFRLMSRFER
jgi:peptidylprolyl isomerase